MLSSLNSSFFNEAEINQLRTLGLWPEAAAGGPKLAFAGLMLTPIMEIVVHDSATTSAEFESVVKYIRGIQREFELPAREKIEAIGTDMGLLPMIPGTWKKENFLTARTLLKDAMNRLPEEEAKAVRTAICRGALAVALAGSSHLISLHALDRDERALLRDLIGALELDKCAEGMELLENSTEA